MKVSTGSLSCDDKYHMAALTPSPLEKVFGFDAGSTPSIFDQGSDAPIVVPRSTMTDPTSGEIIERKTTDVTTSDVDREERIEELEVDGQLSKVHENAIIAFEAQNRLAQEVDPKFAARNAEVAAQYLKIALDSVHERVEARYKRSKVKLARDKDKSPQGGVVNNNVIMADRNMLMQMMKAAAEKTVTGVEIVKA